MVIQLGDLVKKWITDCETVQALLEKLVVEQLMNKMQTNQKVCVSKRKPNTGEAAGELAYDYIHASQRD